MIPPEKLRSEPTVVQSRTIAVPASAQINRDFSVVKNIKQESSDGNAPLGSKLNLFKVLKNHQNGNKPDVFTTIGNRIVIPMKICVSAKKKFPSGGENVTEMPSTFRMAVPANKVSPSSKNTTTIYKVEPSTDSTSVTTFTTTTKTIVSKSKEENYGDLNKFMSTVTPNFPPKPRELPSPPKPAPDFDDELTSLSWLMSGNKELLDTIRRCNPDDPGISLSGDDMESDDEGGKGIFTATSKVDKQSYASRPTVLTEYNPLSKPPYSFSCLIFMAVENSAEKMLPVKDIYNWVCRNFPYFRTAPSGWKNSIRHNLSLNRCFKKADIKEGAKDTVKGSLWCIDPAYRPNLVQALKRSPFYPYLHPTGIGQPLSLNNLANLLPGVQTGRVPTWSPNFPPTGNLWADPDMASAALNLMELRQNEPPKRSDSITTTLQQLQEEIFKDAERSTRRDRSVSCTSVGGEQVVITGSTQDHNYSCSTSPMTSSADDVERCASPESDKSAPDAAYEFETGSWSEGSGSDVEALFDSGFASLRSFTTNDHCDVITDKQKKKRKRKSGGKSSKKIKVKVNGNKKHKGSKIRGGSKNSDVDSGKDSPKVSRVQRRRKISQSPLKKKPRNSHQSPVKSKSRDSNLGQSPPLKKKSRDAVSQSRKRSFDRLEDRPKLKFRNSASPSNYNTRSSGQQALPGSGRLPGQQQHPPERRSKRRRANSDIDEEVQLAAGSLLRLAGLSSPLPPPRDKTT